MYGIPVRFAVENRGEHVKAETEYSAFPLRISLSRDVVSPYAVSHRLDCLGKSSFPDWTICRLGNGRGHQGHPHEQRVHRAASSGGDINFTRFAAKVSFMHDSLSSAFLTPLHTSSTSHLVS